MGKSNTIKTQAQVNKEFQAYLTKIEADLQERSQKKSEEFGTKVQEYYQTSGYDMYVMMEGQNVDFRQTFEFNTTSIAQIINNIANSVFGASEGDEEAEKRAATILDYKVMAAKVATSFITDTLNAFTIGGETTFTENYVAESICPGLTLHLFVAEDSFKEKSFFDNNFIMESIVKYQVIFSYKKGQAEMDISYLDNHAKMLVKFHENVRDMKAALADCIVNDKIPFEDIDKYQERIRFLEKLIEDTRKELDNLMHKRR